MVSEWRQSRGTGGQVPHPEEMTLSESQGESAFQVEISYETGDGLARWYSQ